jgi:hypothetical protein
MNQLQFRRFGPKFAFFLLRIPKAATASSSFIIRLPKLSLFLFLSLFSLPALATTYYVTQAGGGSHDGSSIGNSWSLADFNGKTTPQGGDTVSFSGSFSDTVTPVCNGSDNGAGRLTLDMRAATLTNANPRIQLTARAYLTLLGGTMASAYDTTCINFNPNGGGQSHDITIDGWQYTGADNGIAYFLSLNHVTYLTVSNCTVDNVSSFVSGDSSLNHDILLTGCYARTSTDVTTQDDLLRIADAANITIEKCKLIGRAPADPAGHHNDIIQTYTKGGSNPGSPTNWVIRYNWFEMQNTTGSGDCSFLMFQSMTGDPALKLYGNVFFGSATIGNNGVCVGRNNGGSYYCYNNTFVRHVNPNNMIRFNDSGTFYLKNNVGMNDPSIYIYDINFINSTMSVGAADYNFLYLTHLSSNWAGPHGSVSLNPLFSDYAGNDFSLQAGSPLLNKGDRSIGAEYSTGIAPGATWPNPALVDRSTSWNVGAY